MEKEVRATIFVEDAYRVEAYASDFEGENWKTAFYNIWRYQMTFSFAHSIRVGERRVKGVYVSLLVRPSYLKNVKEMMEDLGYRNVSVDKEKVGIVPTYDIDDPATDGMYEVFAD